MAEQYTQKSPIDKSTAYSITVEGTLGYFPNQTNALTLDTDTSHTHHTTVASVPATTQINDTSSQVYTYETTPALTLVDSQVQISQIYRKTVVSGTTPSTDPVSATQNEINFDTNMIKGAGRVIYCSFGSVYDTTQTITFVPHSSIPSIISPYLGQQSYMAYGNEIYKTYEDVWGTGSTPSGFNFAGWNIYRNGTLIGSVTSTGTNAMADSNIFDTIQGNVTLTLYPIFNNTNKYVVSVDYDDAQATVTIA